MYMLSSKVVIHMFYLNYVEFKVSIAEGNRLKIGSFILTMWNLKTQQRTIKQLRTMFYLNYVEFKVLTMIT